MKTKTTLLLISVMFFSISSPVVAKDELASVLVQTDTSDNDGGMEQFITKDHGIERNAWKVRILNIENISNVLKTLEFAQWCKAESTKTTGLDEPCKFFIARQIDDEANLKEAINVTIMMLDKLKNMPITDQISEHIIILEHQLNEMKSLPTPVADGLKEANK